MAVLALGSRLEIENWRWVCVESCARFWTRIAADSLARRPNVKVIMARARFVFSSTVCATAARSVSQDGAPQIFWLGEWYRRTAAWEYSQWTDCGGCGMKPSENKNLQVERIVLTVLAEKPRWIVVEAQWAKKSGHV